MREIPKYLRKDNNPSVAGFAERENHHGWDFTSFFPRQELTLADKIRLAALQSKPLRDMGSEFSLPFAPNFTLFLKEHIDGELCVPKIEKIVHPSGCALFLYHIRANNKPSGDYMLGERSPNSTTYELLFQGSFAPRKKPILGVGVTDYQSILLWYSDRNSGPLGGSGTGIWKRQDEYQEIPFP